MFFRRKTEIKRLNELKSWLVLTEANYAYMERVNDYFREHGTTAGCPGVPPETARIMAAGARSRGPEDPLPYSDYEILYDYYEIRRLKREIAELEDRIAAK